jgi:transposase
MPVPLSLRVREQIIEQKSKGVSLLDISLNLHVSYCTVRNICKRFQTYGTQRLAADYKHCGRPASSNPADVCYRAALWLKRLHPGWGAAFINLQLRQRYGQCTGAVSSERTLQRWFKAKGLNRAKSQLCCSQPLWAKQEHEVWQIDAKEKLCLASGDKACYLTIVDEKSGCLLKTGVFPLQAYQRGKLNGIARHDV